MTRLIMLLSILVLSDSIAVHPLSVRGQESDLASFLPERDTLPVGLVVVDEGTRSLDEVANTFVDPLVAKRQLELWGWQENAVLELAPEDASASLLALLQISLHRFESEPGAADAMAYFLAEREAGLGLQEVRRPSSEDESQAIEGPVDGGFESTVYARVGAIVIRVTARRHDTVMNSFVSTLASRQASNISDAISGFGHYVSPQFGYVIEWRKSYWTRAETSSLPGIRDELLLFSDNAALMYRGEVAGPSVQPSADHVLLPGGRGLITRTIIASAGSWAGPLPPGIVREDWAAANDQSPPQAPPFGLETVPTEGLTSDLIAQATPQTAGRLDLIGVKDVPPPGHWNVSILGGGPMVTYADPNDASVRADIMVDDVAPGTTANEAIRYMFNLLFFAGRIGERGIQGADVRLDAPIPYFLTGNPDVGYQLLFGTRDGNWVATVRAPTLEDLEVLVRALVTSLPPRPTGQITAGTNSG